MASSVDFSLAPSEVRAATCSLRSASCTRDSRSMHVICCISSVGRLGQRQAQRELVRQRALRRQLPARVSTVQRGAAARCPNLVLQLALLVQHHSKVCHSCARVLMDAAKDVTPALQRLLEQRRSLVDLI